MQLMTQGINGSLRTLLGDVYQPLVFTLEDLRKHGGAFPISTRTPTHHPIPAMSIKQKCPKCGNPECDRDSVHNGLAMLYGPWGCHECGWSEDSDYDISEGPKVTSDGYTIDQFGGATPHHGT